MNRVKTGYPRLIERIRPSTTAVADKKQCTGCGGTAFNRDNIAKGFHYSAPISCVSNLRFACCDRACYFLFKRLNITMPPKSSTPRHQALLLNTI